MLFTGLKLGLGFPSDYRGPNCTVLRNISFHETDAIGTCSNDTVVCSPVYSGVSLTSTYSSDGLFAANSSENNSSLSTRVCVVGTLVYTASPYNVSKWLHSLCTIWGTVWKYMHLPPNVTGSLKAEKRSLIPFLSYSLSEPLNQQSEGGMDVQKFWVARHCLTRTCFTVG